MERAASAIDAASKDGGRRVGCRADEASKRRDVINPGQTGATGGPGCQASSMAAAVTVDGERNSEIVRQGDRASGRKNQRAGRKAVAASARKSTSDRVQDRPERKAWRPGKRSKAKNIRETIAWLQRWVAPPRKEASEHEQRQGDRRPVGRRGAAIVDREGGADFGRLHQAADCGEMEFGVGKLAPSNEANQCLCRRATKRSLPDHISSQFDR